MIDGPQKDHKHTDHSNNTMIDTYFMSSLEIQIFHHKDFIMTTNGMIDIIKI